MKDNRPTISIIIVTFNAGEQLTSAIDSVLQQNYEYLELVIIDGGSSDGSVELIKKYETQLAGWISEPDKGIYDAMNKGIGMATGEWIYFLGADDQLQPSIISKVQTDLDPLYKAIFGKVRFSNGAIMKSELSLRIILQNTVHHQSVFYHKSLFDKFRYDISFRAIADYELNLKIWLDKLPFKRIEDVIACCNAGGTSSNFSISLGETNSVRKKWIPNVFLQGFLSFLLRLYYYQKKLRKVSLVGIKTVNDK